jgi:nucleoside-diphosphate-sugar epimerase
MKNESTLELRPRVLLTGGSGFLGRAMVSEILDPSSPLPVKEVVILDLAPFKGMNNPRIRPVLGDIRNREVVDEITKGIDLVIHSAAIVDWGTSPEKEVYSINEEGTRNILEACRRNGVKALVFTSSLDVLHNGDPLVNVDEEAPYPEEHSNAYCGSKCAAEKRVIESNSPDFQTCSLRPADIYGEWDPYHLGPLIQMARRGFYVRLGNGMSRCQHVYVGNVAYAHLLAAGALLNGDSAVAGNSYFITDCEGSNFFSFFDRIIEGAGYKIWPKNLWLPRWFAYGLGSISELFAFLLRPVRQYTPKMSRFAVIYTCTDYTFTSEKARNDFNFTPKYSQEEALERTVNHFRNENSAG